MAGIIESRGKFPMIDADPHASRVIRYMRRSDYLWWAGATVIPPAIIYVTRTSFFPTSYESRTDAQIVDLNTTPTKQSLETAVSGELAALAKLREAGRPAAADSTVMSVAARMAKATATPRAAMIGVGITGFMGGFLIAYQNSSCMFRF